MLNPIRNHLILHDEGTDSCVAARAIYALELAIRRPIVQFGGQQSTLFLEEDIVLCISDEIGPLDLVNDAL